MAQTLTVLFVSSLVLFLVWRVVRPGVPRIQNLNDWETKKYEIDLAGFLLLLDKTEEDYLRRSLPPAEFRIYQRRRLRLAIRCLGMVGKNAMMLMRLGQLAKSKADPELMKDAEELIYAALRLRVNSLLVQPYLGLKWLFPGWTMSVPTFALPYEELLSCLTRVRQHQQLGNGVLTLS